MANQTKGRASMKACGRLKTTLKWSLTDKRCCCLAFWAEKNYMV